MKRRLVYLTAEQRRELLHMRDHDPLPYMRTKAAAIVKVADGWPICRVAAIGLNKPYHEDTVRSWINRYEQEGLEGLRVKRGRGRKPVFSPCLCMRASKPPRPICKVGSTALHAWTVLNRVAGPCKLSKGKLTGPDAPAPAKR